MPRSEFAHVNGIRLHYMAEGLGPLVLFLHGFPEFWYEWRLQLADLGRDHLAVAPDLRGYNLSDKPSGLQDYRLPALVEDVRQLALHVGAEKFVLVGHDWGGAVAWAFAAMHPEMLRGLVIANMAHPGIFARELRRNPDQQRASGYMLLFRSDQAEEALSANDYAALQQAVLGSGPVTDEDRKAYLEAWSRPGALTGGLNYYRAARIGPPQDGAAEVIDPEVEAIFDKPIDVPTLVIWGMQDTALLPGNLDGLSDAVPGVKVVRVDDATHWIVREKPDVVNAEIRAFLTSL